MGTGSAFSATEIRVEPISVSSSAESNVLTLNNTSEQLETSGWCAWNWVPTSMKAIEEAEKRLLTSVKSYLVGKYAPIRHKNSQLWTLVAMKREPEHLSEEYLNKIPLVLVHGFGGGVGLWAQNLDSFTSNRPVYSFDLMGFGRSSRPKFSGDATLAETEWVQSMEDWRRHMGLEKIILLGHSLGGFLASSYALEYPDRVRHLVLVDPWGFPAKPPPETTADRQLMLPIWVRAVARVLTVFNPLSSLRAAGPWGRHLVKRIRPDLGVKFAGEEEGDVESVFDYIYHCNVQYPSGEAAFKSMTVPFGWAKRPMIERIPKLRHDVPVTFVYGSRSWLDNTPGYQMQHDLRPNTYVNVNIVRGAGHHVYADKPEEFNETVLEVCEKVDEGSDLMEDNQFYSS